MRARRLAASALLAAGLTALGGCYASNVVDPGQRGVQEEQVALTWKPAAGPDELKGFWESTEVSGSSAGALLKAYYWFDPSGVYSGAALVLDDGQVRFLTLAEQGEWTLDASGLDLHDGSGALAAEVARAPEGKHLRLVTPESAITFREVPLE